MNSNIKFKNGDYFVEEGRSSDRYVHVVIAKNPMNIYETRITVVGKKEGQPPADFMPISEQDVVKLQRQQNIRKREQFLGF